MLEIFINTIIVEFNLYAFSNYYG